VIAEVKNATRGAWWAEDGNIFLASPNSLFRIPATGGKMEALLSPGDKGYATFRQPQVLPGGERVLLTVHSQGADFDEAHLAVYSLKSGELKVVLRGGYFGRYVPSGHLVYVRNGALLGVSFDLSRLEVKGEPLRLVDDLGAVWEFAAGQFDFSRDGTFAYLSGRANADQRRLAWVDPAAATPLFTADGPVSTPKFAPDGNRL